MRISDWSSDVCSSDLELLGAEDRAAEAASLAVDMLGRRIDDDVGAEFEWPLQQRRREDVVDHDLGAGRMRQRRHRRQIDDLQSRVRRRFPEEADRKTTRLNLTH